MAESVSTGSHGTFKLFADQRERYESRTGQGFGRDPDRYAGLVRTRLGLSVFPRKWLKISAMAVDSRAPWYGDGAPNNFRDETDIAEAYVELRPGAKTGPGMTAGRIMLTYGEGRLLGSPQWSNVTRTWDHLRVWYGTPRAHLEFLLLSPVKVRVDDFNYPAFGDRIWGMYNTFPDLWKKRLVDLYFLRHEQNRPGGFTGGDRARGTDRLAVNTVGFRLAGPIGKNYKFSIEGAAQNGSVGPASHRGAAWFSALGRHGTLKGRPADATAEYKFASGARNPSDPRLSRTFDQLYPANHDKFGHLDLFGWRNIHSLRAVVSHGLAKDLVVSGMYDNSWLASATDSLYSGAGRSIARVANGSAGHHIGQECDVFATYRYRHFQFGAGYGYLWTGAFLRQATPGVSPSLFYVFHTYSL
jgi:hypothetical protein